ncbi:MAG: TMEM165/GDT1 family protein [Lachnospira eligens]
MMMTKKKAAANQRLSLHHWQFFSHSLLAELGDKTQLTAITFGANEGMSAAFVVWIGCSLGLLRRIFLEC